jgi:pyruvate/2-oxoglutarate dehydrogenase complex dihydrolipoamide acyltransferase (E2) component
MKLVVRLPRFSPAVDAVAVTAWGKVPGDLVDYGDFLCDVVVQEVTRMRRPLSALSKKGGTRYAKIGVQVRYRITALDAGVLSSISVQEGTRVPVGEELAVLESGDAIGEAAARVVVNRIEDEGPDM